MPRFTPVGYAYHIIQRGNNRQAIFNCDEDFAAYANWLKEYAVKHEVDIHAWVFMTNHVHLLASPKKPDGISLLMQSLGRMYVRYFNKTWCRSGTLWEGRFKSCLVADDAYLMGCYRYIELNPVRAGMVSDPADYVWSSYQCNALGRRSEILSPHDAYLELGPTDEERQMAYRSLFQAELGEGMIKDIREATNRGLAVGNERFKQEIAANYKRRLKPGRVGRPKKEASN